MVEMCQEELAKEKQKTQTLQEVVVL